MTRKAPAKIARQPYSRAGLRTRVEVTFEATGPEAAALAALTARYGTRARAVREAVLARAAWEGVADRLAAVEAALRDLRAGGYAPLSEAVEDTGAGAETAALDEAALAASLLAAFGGDEDEDD